MIAVDNSTKQTQRELMQAVSDGIGNGTVEEMSIDDAMKHSWAEFMTIDVKLKCSKEFSSDCFEWCCFSGINAKTMPGLNEEFNHSRGLFPLKVFITGPPCSGKTHFASQLQTLYGIPHLKIEDIVNMGKSLTSGYGKVLKSKIEELKDQAEADYEKTRKKKDPDFDRSTCNPRLPDECMYELVKIQLNSAGCMNKGFILEGYPRTAEDVK